MGKLGHMAVMGRICGTAFGGFWRAAQAGMGALFTRLPYQPIARTRLNQLEDCEAALKVLIAQMDQRTAGPALPEAAS